MIAVFAFIAELVFGVVFVILLIFPAADQFIFPSVTTDDYAKTLSRWVVIIAGMVSVSAFLYLMLTYHQDLGALAAATVAVIGIIAKFGNSSSSKKGKK